MGQSEVWGMYSDYHLSEIGLRANGEADVIKLRHKTPQFFASFSRYSVYRSLSIGNDTVSKIGSRKALLLMFATAIVALGMSWYSDYKRAVEEVSAQIDEELATRVNGLSMYVDTWMEMNLNMLRQNASLSDIVSMNSAQQIPILRSIAREYAKWMDNVITINAHGETLARSDDKEKLSYADRAWFVSALKGPYASDVQLGKTQGSPILVLAVPHCWP